MSTTKFHTHTKQQATTTTNIAAAAAANKVYGRPPQMILF